MNIKNKILAWLLLFLFLTNHVAFSQSQAPVSSANLTEPLTQTGQEIEKIPLTEKISLDYKDADILNVIRSLSYTYGLNLVTSTEVKGKITISLKDVTLAEALDAILSANGYNYSSKGNIIYITPGVAEGAQLVSEPITMKYLKAADAQNLLRKVLSPKGDIKVDEISNMLIVTDYQASIEKLKSLLKSVDQAPQQVLIEAKIVDITSKDLRNLGVTWQADLNPSKGLFSRENVETISERLKGTGTFAGPSSSLSGGQLKLDTLVLKGLTATATIDALIQDQKAHLLASPSIAVLNNREARIIIGEKVPYKERTQTTTGTTETTKFIDVGTTLRVTPSINADGYITLNVHPEVSSLKGTFEGGPHITTREADTTVRVKEGETIVIGGLIKQEDNRTQSRVPILGYIPVLGYLFGNRSKDQTQTELTVFITPKILRSREEMLAEGKKHFEEEAYVNIMATASLNTQMKLFEKARNLQTGSGLESVRKEDWHRKRQAISIYESILTQFPDGPKAPESGYQAAIIYYQIAELYPARDLCKKLISDYPDSVYAAKAKSLYRAIERRLNAITYRKQPIRLREEEHRKAEQQRQEERRQAQREAQRKQEELIRQKEEARKRAEEEVRRKSEEKHKKSAEKARIQEEERQKAEQERQAQLEKQKQAQLEAQRKKEELARQKKEERKIAQAEGRKKSEEQAFINALHKQEADKKAEQHKQAQQEAQRKKEELARQSEEARQKAQEESQRKKEELARQQVEQAQKAKEEAQRKKEELARQREEQRQRNLQEIEQARLKAKEEVRKKSEEQAFIQALRKQEAAALKEKAAQLKEEKRKQAEELAAQKEAERKKAEEEVRRKTEEKARLKETARQKAEQQRQAQLEKQKQAQLEAQRKKEELARQREEQRKQAQIEAQRKKAELAHQREELALQRQEQTEARKAQLLKQRQARERELLLQQQEKVRLSKEKAEAAKEEVRKKSEEQAFLNALRKQEADKKAEQHKQAQQEAQRKKEELARQAAEARQKAKAETARAREQARLKAKEEAAAAKEEAWIKAHQEAVRLKEEAARAKEEATRLREQVPW